MRGRIGALYTLEGYARGGTFVHRLHPAAKILTALGFIVTVVSFGRHDVFGVALSVFYTALVAALSETPQKLLFPRFLAALPFCLFVGITNLFLERGAAFTVWGVTVGYGVLSFAVIVMKTYFCVTAALLLMAVTPFSRLTAQLRAFGTPYLFVLMFEMTYRYIGTLVEEAFALGTAYALRSGGKRGGVSAVVDIRHSGGFVGGLLLKSFDRAERVYAAMRCRGYNGDYTASEAMKRFKGSDAVYCVVVGAFCVSVRLVPLIGSL